MDDVTRTVLSGIESQRRDYRTRIKRIEKFAHTTKDLTLVMKYNIEVKKLLGMIKELDKQEDQIRRNARNEEQLRAVRGE